MAPVRPAAAAPTIAPAVFFRSDLRVSAVLSAEDSTALRWDETDFLRSLGMRHLNHSVYLQDTSRAAQFASGRSTSRNYSRMARMILQQHFLGRISPSGECAIPIRELG